MGLRDILEAAVRDDPWYYPNYGEIRTKNADEIRLIALAPELAALVLDMGEFITEKFGVDGWLDDGSQALLARLDQLGKEQTDE